VPFDDFISLTFTMKSLQVPLRCSPSKIFFKSQRNAALPLWVSLFSVPLFLLEALSNRQCSFSMKFDVLILLLILWHSFWKFSVECKDTKSLAFSFNFEELVRRGNHEETAGSM
jgi:hypothetical protein